MSAQLLRTVRELGGEAAVAEVLERSRTTRGRDYLINIGNWISYDEATDLWDAASEVTHHRALGRVVGAQAGVQLAGSRVDSPPRSLRSPEEVYRQLVSSTALDSAITTIEIVELGPGHAEILVRARPGYPRSLHLCDWTMGLLSAPPVLFDLPAAQIRHDACAALGAAECRYSVVWPTAAPRASDVVQRLQSELSSARERLRAMFATASDLVGSGSLADALARIADRAAMEVRAPRHLIVVRMAPGEEVLVHAKGFGTAEVSRHCDELMSGAPPPAPDSWLVVPVRSVRRDYGFLVAAHSEDRRSLPQERRLLEAYARHAAVALDSAAARLDAERRFRQSEALLQFSRQMAGSGTSREIAGRLAESIPVVVDCDEVGVFLWDGTEFTSYALEWPDPDALGQERLMPQTWRPRPGGSLERFAADPEMDPVFIDRHGGGTPRDPETLRLLGVSAAIVVPLSARGELLGVVVVMARDRPERLRWSPELSARISGVAAQATVALENGRLLDTVTHQARHDRLTGLANRVQFGADLDEAVARSGRQGELVALFYLDLDDFKAVNDEFGHEVGDELLVEVAGRLLQGTRVGDAVARLGGDEFAIVVNAPSIRELDRIAARIADALDAPFEMHGRRVRLSVSVGRAVFPSDACDAEELLRLADAAMYRRKADPSRSRR